MGNEAERLAKLETRDARRTQRAVRAAVTGSLTKLGIVGENLEDAVDLFMIRHGAELEVDEDDGVTFANTGVSLDRFLKSQDGAGAFKRYKGGTGSMPAAASSSDPRTPVTGEQAREMIMNGTFDVRKQRVVDDAGNTVSAALLVSAAREKPAQSGGGEGGSGDGRVKVSAEQMRSMMESGTYDMTKKYQVEG